VKVGDISIMTQSQTLQKPRIRLVQNLIKQAELALTSGHLSEAQHYFEKALGVHGVQIDREYQIRQRIEDHSTCIIQQTDDNWAQAREALDLLDSLGLSDYQTKTWQRDLKIKEAELSLKKGNTSESFEIFTRLLTEEEEFVGQIDLRAKIIDVIRRHIPHFAARGEWVLVEDMIGRIQSIWSTEGQLDNWLGTFSKTVRTATQAQDQSQAQIQQLTQQTETLSKSHARLKRLILEMLIIIAVLLIVVIFTIFG
jgi:hypothetical protein